VTLSDSDRKLMAAMMHSSDDDATDTLWAATADPITRPSTRFPRYGMTDLATATRVQQHYPYWGFEKSTANDLDRLINYTLTNLHLRDRSHRVRAAERATNQQWGGGGRGACNGAGQQGRLVAGAGRWVVNSSDSQEPGQRYNARGDEFPRRCWRLRRRRGHDHPTQPSSAGWTTH